MASDNKGTLTVKTVTAKQAHSNLGAVMEDSQHEPVIIQKNGRPYSVVISVREFEKIQKKETREDKVGRLLASIKVLHKQAEENSLTPDIAREIIDGQ